MTYTADGTRQVSVDLPNKKDPGAAGMRMAVPLVPCWAGVGAPAALITHITVLEPVMLSARGLSSWSVTVPR
jgi:hypothetical protein